MARGRVVEREIVEEIPPPPPRRSPWPWLLALLLAALGAIAVAWALTQSGPDTAEVPNVVGFSRERAEERLRAEGFRAVVERRASNEPDGTVLRQVPEPGATLSTGSNVGLVESAGAPEVTVPRLVGLRAPAAARIVRALRLDPVRRVVPSDEPAGLVLSQNPEAGDRVARGSRVLYVVAQGPALVEVPAVRGLSRENAEARLRQASLVAVVREVPAAAPAGTVVAQDPPGGQKVERGSNVSLNVSGALIEVPALRGLTEERATELLEELGLTAVVVGVPSTQPEGTVDGQNPPPGARVRKGTEVRINVVTATVD